MALPEFIMARLLPFSMTTSEWAASNPVPKQGEMVIEVTGSSALKMKIGDGLTPYLSLPFYSGGTFGGDLQAVLDAGNSAQDGGAHVGNITLNDIHTPNINQLFIYPDRIELDNNLTGNIVITALGLEFNVPLSAFQTFIGFVNPTASRNIDFPDKSGIVAMLSDITGAGNLQGVLNSGNIASEFSSGVATIQLQDSTGAYISFLRYGSFQILRNTFLVSQLKDDGTGNGQLDLEVVIGPSHFKGSIKTTTSMSADGIVYIPDESTSAIIDRTIVLHTTKDPITVGNPATINSTIRQSRIEVNDILATNGSLVQAGSISVGPVGDQILINRNTGAFNIDFTRSGFTLSVVATTPTAARTVTIPDQSGIILLSGNDISIQHLKGSTATPGIAAGAGAGTGPTVSIAGDDLGGIITVTTGTLPTLSATIATVTFNVPYTVAPKVVLLNPANSSASLLSGANMVFVNFALIGTTTFAITSGTTALAPATTYLWYYFIKQ